MQILVANFTCDDRAVNNTQFGRKWQVTDSTQRSTATHSVATIDLLADARMSNHRWRNNLPFTSWMYIYQQLGNMQGFKALVQKLQRKKRITQLHAEKQKNILPFHRAHFVTLFILSLFARKRTTTKVVGHLQHCTYFKALPLGFPTSDTSILGVPT